MKQLIGFWRDECDLLQRILLAALAGMIVVFGVLTVAFRFHQGVEFDGALLKKNRHGCGHDLHREETDRHRAERG